ncbi:MAG: hypothetical protein ACLRTZ_16250 [Agathobacter sp.]
MDQEKQHDIALMRYSVISPVISGLPETYSSLEAFYRDASKKEPLLLTAHSNTLHPPRLNDGTGTTVAVVLMHSFRRDASMKVSQGNLMTTFSNRFST